MSEPSKTRTSFYRRLYVAWLISQGTDTVPAIMEATGMPRRTAQDTLSALAELDISCAFEQTEGARHLQGHIHALGDRAISHHGPHDDNDDEKNENAHPITGGAGKKAFQKGVHDNSCCVEMHAHSFPMKQLFS